MPADGHAGGGILRPALEHGIRGNRRLEPGGEIEVAMFLREGEAAPQPIGRGE